jgi:hypothetical protein
VGIAYYWTARLSLALLVPDGVAVFWPAAGVASVDDGRSLVSLQRDLEFALTAMEMHNERTMAISA